MEQFKDDGIDLSVSLTDYQQYSTALESINSSLLSRKPDWINRAACNLLELTKTDNTLLKFVILKSEAFATLCTRFSESKVLFILRIMLNLSAQCPRIIHQLINSNLIYTCLQNLSSFSNDIVITSLKIINNIIISSYFSRLCLVSSNFFAYAFNFLKSPNQLMQHHQRMAIYIEYLIKCFFNPFEPLESASPRELNHPDCVLETLTQTYQILASNPNNSNIDLNMATAIINNNNCLILESNKDPFWQTISILLEKNDSVMIKSALVSIRTMMHQSAPNSIFILRNTSLFDMCKAFCSRKNDHIIANFFSILSLFYIYDENTSNKLFLRNGLFEFVFKFVGYENEAVRLSALRLLSNAICIPENEPITSQIFNEQFVNHLMTVLQTDSETSFHEKEETLFMIFNVALGTPRIIYPLFNGRERMELMIDYLTMVSNNTCIVELRALDLLIEHCTDDSFLQLFVQCNGIGSIEMMLNSSIEYISEAAERFYEKHLKSFSA